MNPTRERILTFIREFEHEFGRTPYVNEIAVGLSMKPETVSSNLHILQDLRYVRLGKMQHQYKTVILEYRLPGEAAVAVGEG